MASKIPQEELQQEETNSVKNPPRRHYTARRNQWRHKFAEKTLKKKLMASRHLPKRHPTARRNQ